MALKLTAGDITALEALGNLEEQVIFVCQKLETVQKTWNTTNPQFQRRAIEVNADFVGGTVAVQIALPLEASSFAAASVSEAFPLAAPVA